MTISSGTSPVVIIVLITLAAAFVLMAWQASSQNCRKTRKLIAYLKENAIFAFSFPCDFVEDRSSEIGNINLCLSTWYAGSCD